MRTGGPSIQILGYLGAFWGLAGIAALLGFSIWRLAAVAADAWSYEFYIYHWIVLAAHVVFMAWSEGYRGFQQSFRRASWRGPNTWSLTRTSGTCCWRPSSAWVISIRRGAA